MEKLPFTFEDIAHAARECMRGSGWKDSVARWRKNLLGNCRRLESELLSGAYREGRPHQFRITSPKERTVSALLFRDRIVHKLACHQGGLIEDLFRNAFADNCACQAGKGTSYAIGRLERQLHRHYAKYGASGYVLELDVRHFFDSIPHRSLVDFVYAKVRNPWTRKTVTRIIDAYPGDRGIGLGSEVSQVLANAYLTPVDFVCKMRLGCECYVRYADNITIVLPETVEGTDGEGNAASMSGRDYARHVLEGVRYALSTLGLDLNPKSALHPLKQGISFLGFRWKLTASGKIVRKVRRESVGRMRRKARKLAALVRNGEITPRQACDSIESWYAYASQATTSAAVRRLADKFKEQIKCES